LHQSAWCGCGRSCRCSQLLGVTFVHVILAMPLAVLAIGASLSNLDPRL
jgi:hypothetical protein